jgi:response regulator RpfG family c-di-GMP phosphodiesterase
MDTASKHLLFVDDEVLVLEMFGRMLGDTLRQGVPWKPHFAQDADEALRIASQYDLDVVVTDVMMPGKDGFDLLQSLRASPRTAKVPTIVVTGDSEPALKRRALDLGATDLLTKPLNREDLLARIRSALRLKSYQDQVEEQVLTLDRRVEERTVELEESHREIVWRLAKAGEYRDDITGNHVVRVACYSRAIAEGLGDTLRQGVPQDFIDTLFLTSPLHDVGKIGVPDSILLKRGPLTPDERKAMQEHCRMGVEILMREPKAVSVYHTRGYSRDSTGQSPLRNPLLKMAAVVAKHHHEKWDGAGYPEGLLGNSIPLEARIVALADVYDAVTSERPYKPAFSREKALAIVREEAGRHFDPQIVAAFERNQAEVAAIYAELCDGDTLRQGVPDPVGRLT